MEEVSVSKYINEFDPLLSSTYLHMLMRRMFKEQNNGSKTDQLLPLSLSLRQLRICLLSQSSNGEYLPLLIAPCCMNNIDNCISTVSEDAFAFDQLQRSFRTN